MATSTSRTITVLDPTTAPRQLRHSLAQRLPELGGKAVGFLWNSKPNGDVLFGRLEELLRQKYEMIRAVHESKPRSSEGATQRVLDGLASAAHLAVVGLGD